MLNLGTEFTTPRDSWVELTNRIEAILHHQPSLLMVDKIIEAEAQRIVSNLLQRKKEYAPIVADETAADYCTVDVDSVQSSALRSVGIEHMAYECVAIFAVG